MMNAAWSKAALDDLEASTFAENKIRCWDSHIGERNLSMAMWSIIISIDGQHALDLHTWRAVRNKDNGLLLVGVRVAWIRLAEHNVDLASRVTCARGPPFLRTCQQAVTRTCHKRTHRAVQNIMITVTLDV